ncbi:class II glutamine amidotransferase [Sneathiella limimaris]|uniref:class II glutamine amidotransferase n=1 Tax=Sneathiella limimaris TaxID=1964213 RepID=UPI00146D9B4A|nr:class II glutamine amidotransferase [Sneathiella limimaris]
MCRWLAYFGTPRVIESFVYEGDHSLSAQALHSHKAKLGVQGDGGGLGWYSHLPEPGLYRNPGPAWSDPNLRELSCHVTSHIFFAHVRASTGAPNIFVNCHPFRYGKWLFMHNGQIGGFSQIKRRLQEHLTDVTYTALQGSTDSEMLFMIMASKGLEKCPKEALRDTVSIVEEIRRSEGIEEPFRATFAISNGEQLWTLKWASDAQAPSLFYRNNDPTSVLVVSEPLDKESTSWIEINENSLLHFCKQADGQITEKVERFL